jgi:hypothetical protein
MTFTKIKGISEYRRLPRLGKIRLGFKVQKGQSQYPAELPFFLLPEEVAKVYGGKVSIKRAEEMGVKRKDVLEFIGNNTHRLAEEINIMFPVNDADTIFPHAYKWYGKSKGVKCTGNREHAMRYNEQIKALEQIECPCEKVDKECTKRGHLLCALPEINMGGIYQIDLGSYHSIVDINSGIDYVIALIGRVALVPLKLRRVPKETNHDNHKQIHYPLQITCDLPIDAINQLRESNKRLIESSDKYVLPPPEDEIPENIVECDEEPKQEQKTKTYSNSGVSNVNKKTTTNFTFLEIMARVKKALNDDSVYYDILGQYGVEKSNQILDSEIQKKVWFHFIEKLNSIHTITINDIQLSGVEYRVTTNMILDQILTQYGKEKIDSLNILERIEVVKWIEKKD